MPFALGNFAIDVRIGGGQKSRYFAILLLLPWGRNSAVVTSAVANSTVATSAVANPVIANSDLAKRWVCPW